MHLILYLLIDLYWKTFRNTTEVKLVGVVVFVYFAEWSCESFVFLSYCSLSLCSLFWNEVSFCFSQVRHSVVLFSGETRQKIKGFSRFLDIAYSGMLLPICF